MEIYLVVRRGVKPGNGRYKRACGWLATPCEAKVLPESRCITE